MREINECTAEVFRRSEKRIKERKRNRNRILMCCIPLLVCITVFSAAVLPAMLPASKSNNSAGEGMDIMGDVNGTSAVFTRVEIVSPGIGTQSSVVKEDADEVARIYYMVQSSFVSSGEGSKENANDGTEDDMIIEENKDFSQSETTGASSGHRIIFTAKNGTQSFYLLLSDKLINISTKQETILSSDQRTNLLNTLGLTITSEEGPQ